MTERTIDPAPSDVENGPPASADAVRYVLPFAGGSTVVVLVAFVTPLATGVRTAAALGVGPAALTWVLSAMSVGLAIALLTTGVLADDRGHRRVFVAGLVVLGVASAVAAAAGHVGIVIAARLVGSDPHQVFRLLVFGKQTTNNPRLFLVSRTGNRGHQATQ